MKRLLYIGIVWNLAAFVVAIFFWFKVVDIRMGELFSDVNYSKVGEYTQIGSSITILFALVNIIVMAFIINQIRAYFRSVIPFIIVLLNLLSASFLIFIFFRPNHISFDESGYFVALNFLISLIGIIFILYLLLRKKVKLEDDEILDL